MSQFASPRTDDKFGKKTTTGRVFEYSSNRKLNETTKRQQESSVRSYAVRMKKCKSE